MNELIFGLLGMSMLIAFVVLAVLFLKICAQGDWLLIGMGLMGFIFWIAVVSVMITGYRLVSGK